MIESASKGRELSQGFLRQRRNVLLMSILVPVLFASGASVEKVNILGTSISIENPAVVQAALLVLLLYFWWRYYQYRREEGHEKDTRLACWSDILDSELEYFSKRVKERVACFSNKHSDPFFPRQANEWSGLERRPPKISNDRRISYWRRSRIIEINGVDSKYGDVHARDSILTDSEKAQIKASGWQLVTGQRSDSRSEPIFSTEIDYIYHGLIWLRLKATIVFFFRRPHFTDYGLPFWLGAISILISGGDFLEGVFV